MYLSQLHLNRLNRGVLQDLISPDDLHRTICQGFPDQQDGGTGRILFRIEPADPLSDSPPRILVQSEKPPDWSSLAPHYVVRQETTSLTFATKPDDGSGTLVLHAGDRFRFRLVANPTKKVEGKRHGLYREEDQRAWLDRKAESGGFRVAAASLLLVPLGTLSSRGNGRAGRSWFGVRFEGSLEVTDASRFADSLAHGIGPAKAFGFGLLSVAPLR